MQLRLCATRSMLMSIAQRVHSVLIMASASSLTHPTHNSLPTLRSRLCAKGEGVLEVEPMSRDVLEAVPELNDLLDAL